MIVQVMNLVLIVTNLRELSSQTLLKITTDNLLFVCMVKKKKKNRKVTIVKTVTILVTIHETAHG